MILRRKSVPKVLLAVVLSLSMLAALACSSADDPTAVPAAQQQPAAQPTSAPAQQPTPQTTAPVAMAEPVQEAREGFSRVLVPAMRAPESALVYKDVPNDPDQVIKSTFINRKTGIAPWKEGGVGRMYSAKTFSPIFHNDENNQNRQGIGISYEVSDDQTTYIIDLDPNAVFSDGTPVTAASVKAAWEFGAKPENQVSWGGSLRLLDKVIGFEAVAEGDAPTSAGLVPLDDHTLQINLTSPRPVFPMELTSWTLGIFKEEQARANPDWEQKPIGTGPYKISDFNPDQGTVTVAADENWWRGDLTVQGIDIIPVPDKPTQLIMYDNGELDIILASIGFQPTVHDPSYKYFDEVYVMASGGIWRFAFKTMDPPFDDIEVRRGLSHGVDMKTVVAAVFGPNADWATGNVMPQVECHNPEQPGYTFDIARAKEHLAKSKYGDPATWPLIKVSVSRPQFVRVAVALQEQWKDNLGVTNMEVVKLESGQRAPEGRNLLRTSGATPLSVPDGIANRFWLSKNQKSHRHELPELDAKVESALLLPLDTPNRCEIFQALEDEYLSQYFWMPVLWGVKAWLVSPWAIGFEAAIYRDFNSLEFMRIGQRDRSFYRR
jgi:ABC-type transport system substrate-binding protein